MDNEKSEEMIQLEMQQTRASLTEKLETLEQKVVGTVENATTAVSQTVDTIKETVQDTVATVQEGVKEGVDSVKDFLDVPAHVQRRPWLMLGGSVAVGYCLGTLLMRSSTPAAATTVSTPTPAMPMFGNGTMRPERPEKASAPLAPAEPSFWESEVAKLKGLALGVLFGTAREMLVSSMPEHMSAQLKDVVDSVTRKVGGDPIPSSDWDEMRAAPPHAEGSPPEEQATPAATQTARHEPGNGHPAAARRW